jgi:catechol 2,3-dioxygenase-like lactoylglutathione lyase family enzyme
VNEHVVTTLGVDDIDAAKRFYADALGLPIARDGEVFVHFAPVDDTFGLVLYAGPALAYDAGLLTDGEHHGVTMSYIVETAERVDVVMARAEKAGARILELPHTAAWGGYIGYFVAPDGNLWKVVVAQQG